MLCTYNLEVKNTHKKFFMNSNILNSNFIMTLIEEITRIVIVTIENLQRYIIK